jgi:hypothetical protein
MIIVTTILSLFRPVHAQGYNKNEVKIILNEDGKTGYASPKNKVIDLTGNSPVHKVKFSLWQKKSGHLISLKTNDHTMNVNFVEPTKPDQPSIPGGLECKNNKKWQDKKPKNPLKKSKRHFIINTNKHKNGDCYTYEITVNTGQREILIDPWLIIKR